MALRIRQSDADTWQSMLCLEDNLAENYGDNWKWRENIKWIACLDHMLVIDAKMTPIMLYRAHITRIIGHNIFYSKLKINNISIRRATVEYIMAYNDIKRRHQKCDFHESTPLECIPTRNKMPDTRIILQI